MGYSARYHVASLTAVFLALAIGILVGAEFGGEVLSDTRKSLERSLVNNLEESREEVNRLESQLERSEEFGQRVFPALAGGRLLGDRVGLIGIGGIDTALVDDVEATLSPTGAELAGIGVLRRPPRLDSLARAFAGTRFAKIDEDPELLQELGVALGRRLAQGGGALIRLRGEFFSRASGNFGDLDQVVLAYQEPDPESLDEADAEAAERLERGLIQGLAASDTAVVGVETTEAEPSAIRYFNSLSIPSVDNIDQISGKLALILVLDGAQGSFGIKETADSMLPDLLTGTGSPTLPGVTSHLEGD
jgi:hypothetical protein